MPGIEGADRRRKVNRLPTVDKGFDFHQAAVLDGQGALRKRAKQVSGKRRSPRVERAHSPCRVDLFDRIYPDDYCRILKLPVETAWDSYLLVAVFNWPQIYGYLAGAVSGIAVSATCALLPPWLVRKRVERLNEN